MKGYTVSVRDIYRTSFCADYILLKLIDGSRVSALTLSADLFTARSLLAFCTKQKSFYLFHSLEKNSEYLTRKSFLVCILRTVIMFSSEMVDPVTEFRNIFLGLLLSSFSNCNTVCKIFFCSIICRIDCL